MENLPTGFSVVQVYAIDRDEVSILIWYRSSFLFDLYVSYTQRTPYVLYNRLCTSVTYLKFFHHIGDPNLVIMNFTNGTLLAIYATKRIFTYQLTTTSYMYDIINSLS
jgi:hypothetical protein